MSWTLWELAARAALSGMACGRLDIDGCRGGSAHIEKGPGPAATIRLNSPRAAKRAVFGGALGLAEGYLDGDWDTPDLDALLLLGVKNLPKVPRSRTTIRTTEARSVHRRRDNTLEGSRRNIRHHYDLGNEFYRLWLDDTMAYSSAIYRSGEESLEAAQVSKWDRLLELLQPSRTDHLLEIGCGWGGFAIHAAKESGCRVTALTISDEQYEWAARAVERAGLEGRVDVLLEDYRVVSGTFDAVASIEMFEAVGERWWPVYFRQLAGLLKRGGAAALQTITIDDRRFDDYRRHPDFIQRYVFPGGMLPSPTRFFEEATSAGLSVDDPKFFGASYTRTLGEWRDRFERAVPEVQGLGFDERFVRLWRYYLAYCRAGFSAGTVDVMQVRLTP